MSPQDDFKRIRLARLQAFEDALAVVDDHILDATIVSEQTTVHDEVPRWRWYIKRLLKVRDDLVAALYEEP